MQNKKWKKFEKLTAECYSNMIGAVEDGSYWEKAFELFKEIVLEERKKNSGFAFELEMIDDVTEYEYDIQGWLEDCLDEMDMRGEQEVLLKMCDGLLDLFGWPEYTGADLKFRKSTALGALGRNEERVKYCKEWIRKEPDNIVASTAGVYAYMDVKEFEEAEKLVDRFIPDKSKCIDENDIMFTAASKLYEAMGKKKEKKQIDKAIKEYEKYLQQYFDDMAFDEDEEDGMDFWDDDLPFN